MPRPKKQEIEVWQRPFVGCRDPGWTDEFGRRWNKPSDIITNPELQNPLPQPVIKRRKRISTPKTESNK